MIVPDPARLLPMIPKLSYRSGRTELRTLLTMEMMDSTEATPSSHAGFKRAMDSEEGVCSSHRSLLTHPPSASSSSSSFYRQPHLFHRLTTTISNSVQHYIPNYSNSLCASRRSSSSLWHPSDRSAWPRRPSRRPALGRSQVAVVPPVVEVPVVAGDFPMRSGSDGGESLRQLVWSSLLERVLLKVFCFLRNSSSQQPALLSPKEVREQLPPYSIHNITDVELEALNCPLR